MPMLSANLIVSVNIWLENRTHWGCLFASVSAGIFEWLFATNVQTETEFHRKEKFPF